VPSSADCARSQGNLVRLEAKRIASSGMRTPSSRRRFSSCTTFQCSSIDFASPGSIAAARLSTRSVNCGACAARQNSLVTSPRLRAFGSVRWNVWPSSPSRWAMASIARATKSTGTMLTWPPSNPTSGTHAGMAWRRRWMSLKA